MHVYILWLLKLSHVYVLLRSFHVVLGEVLIKQVHALGF